MPTNPPPSKSDCLCVWRERRDWLRAGIDPALLAKVPLEEVEVHFSTMPWRYWERVTPLDLVWGIETVHGFFKLMASNEASPTNPYVDWRLQNESHCARVLLCTWDRHALIAKAAAAFSAVGLNILEADVFTRSDNVILDEFSVANIDGQSPVNEERLREMKFLLDGALSEPPRFASVWACSRHRLLRRTNRETSEIKIDNTSSADNTVIHILASDRLGLLYDVLQSISDAGFDIKQATITTENGLARDTIQITNEHGEKLLGARQLKLLQTSLERVLKNTD